MTSKTVTIQYKPVTSLAAINNISHITNNSHVATIKYHMHYPIFMACMECSCNLLDVISIYSLIPVSYQAVSPTNGLGMRLMS